jgi:phosphomannomutase
MSDIFRAYDVRGIYPEEINTQVALKVANAACRFLKARRIIVAHDVRESSPELASAVLEGATIAGAEVTYIGHSTTPLFYYAVKESGADGGIMITASHNPKEYNGLKIVGKGASPIGLETGLRDIKALYGEHLAEAATSGLVHEDDDLQKSYIEFLRDQVKFSKDLNVVIDAGNGSVIFVIKPLLGRTELNVHQLFFEPNGKFPGRGPDPIKEGALGALQRKVIETGSDIGFAFDGDGDRVTVVNEKGEIVSPQFILALLWQAKGKGKVVYDLRFSRSVKELFGDQGIKSKVGHSFICQAMAKEKADIGGETSGHFFFKEMNYTESSVLAMIALLNYLSASGKKISELVVPLEKYAGSGELNIPIESHDAGMGILQKLKEEYKDGTIDELDGLTVEYDNWWFNIRPSNTEPLLRLVVEATNKELLGQKVDELKQKMS